MSSSAGKRILILQGLKFIIFSTVSSRIRWNDSSWLWLKCLVSYKILCAANEQGMRGRHQSWYFEDGNDFARTLSVSLRGHTSILLAVQTKHKLHSRKCEAQVHNTVWIHLCPKMKPKWTCVNCGQVIGWKARGRWQRGMSWPPNAPSSVQKTLLSVLLSQCECCPAANCHVPGWSLMHVDEYVLVIATSCMRFDVRKYV